MLTQTAITILDYLFIPPSPPLSPLHHRQRAPNHEQQGQQHPPYITLLQEAHTQNTMMSPNVLTQISCISMITALVLTIACHFYVAAISEVEAKSVAAALLEHKSIYVQLTGQDIRSQRR